MYKNDLELDVSSFEVARQLQDTKTIPKKLAKHMQTQGKSPKTRIKMIWS